MIKPFTETETDRTKSRWVARAYGDFAAAYGRKRTTLRALFYYCLQRSEADYPICGGFVGEIRATRRYHESDGERLPKWVDRAKSLGFIPEDAILDDSPAEKIFLPGMEMKRPYMVEVWLNRSAFNALLYPVCERHGAALVSLAMISKDAIADLFLRCKGYTTIILCLSDLSIDGLAFCGDLSRGIAASNRGKDIRVKRIGLTPEQVLSFKIPMIEGKRGTNKENETLYKGYLKPFGLSPKRMAEIDALEIYYPGGVAAFIEDTLSRLEDIEKGRFWLDRRKAIVSGKGDIGLASEKG
jgi:hypothetical protein